MEILYRISLKNIILLLEIKKVETIFFLNTLLHSWNILVDLMKALGWSLILLRFFYTGQYNNILKCENTDLIWVRGWNSDLLQAGKRAAESAIFAAGWGGACTAVTAWHGAMCTVTAVGYVLPAGRYLLLLLPCISFCGKNFMETVQDL